MRKPFHKGAENELFQFAKENRINPTEAEDLLWQELKTRKLDGYKFRRQHPIDTYILDFYCHSKKLCIELDGEYHDEVTQKTADETRTKCLNEFQIKVIRFNNQQVKQNLQYVLKSILQSLNE